MSSKSGVGETQVKNCSQAELPTVNLRNQTSSKLPKCSGGTGLGWVLSPTPKEKIRENKVVACNKSKVSHAGAFNPRLENFLSWFSTVASEPSEVSA